MTMLVNIFLGLGVMTLCLFTQTALLVWLLHVYHKRLPHRGEHTYRSQMFNMSAVMLILVLGNLGQIALWASLFLFLEEFSFFAEAFYFSAVNFATLGYGEIIMSEKHKLLGPLESINGILMVGLSTSSLLFIFQDIIKRALTEVPEK